MIPELISLITSVLAAAFGVFNQVMIRRSQVELERLRPLLEHKRLYSTPLLKSAEELYNKINDVVKEPQRSLGYFQGLSQRVEEIRSVGDLASSATVVYVTHVLYLLARFFASIEAIKKDLGLLELASDKKTREFQQSTRRPVAVFFSGRLHDKVRIRSKDRLRYEGRILEPAQVLIGESVLKEVNGSHQCISYLEFCRQLASDEDFRRWMKPLVDFLGDLEEVSGINYLQASDVDFRWAKLILFAHYLREMIEQMDSQKVTILLPELENYEQEYLKTHRDLADNMKLVEEGYGRN